MNKQQKKTGRGISWTDYTWNAVQGCQHDCHWQMPNGKIAECYAKSQADRMRSEKFFPLGFEAHYWHPERLDEPLKLKRPSKIFLDSVSDLMGHWVPDAQIQAVLDTCAKAERHTFQLLTKNPIRLPKFQYPANVWVGMSVPPTFMNGVQLSPEQQYRWLGTGLAALGKTNAAVRWLSAEPLSFNIAPLIADTMIDWCVIGAASEGGRTYQPQREHVDAALAALRSIGAKVFFKGNLEWSPWYEEFPDAVVTP